MCWSIVLKAAESCQEDSDEVFLYSWVLTVVELGVGKLSVVDKFVEWEHELLSTSIVRTDSH